MITELIILILAFLLLDAFFAGSEAALTSVNKIRLRHLVESQDRKAVMLNEFLKEEGQFLGTTLVGTNISVIISSALATRLLSLWCGKYTTLVSTALMSSVILIFCEVIPKTIFRQSPNSVSLMIIAPLKFMSRALHPIIFIVLTITNFLLKPLKMIKEKIPSPFVTKGDIEEILKDSKKKSIVGPDEKTLVQRIFRLATTTAGQIMTPLTEATLIGINDTVDSLKEKARKTRFSRFPLYENEPFNIKGTVNIYDILFSSKKDQTLKEFIQQPYFINENERIDKILPDLRKKKMPMAIVTNPEGRSIGLVTIEDVLEEIVGDIGG